MVEVILAEICQHATLDRLGMCLVAFGTIIESLFKCTEVKSNHSPQKPHTSYSLMRVSFYSSLVFDSRQAGPWRLSKIMLKGFETLWF